MKSGVCKNCHGAVVNKNYKTIGNPFNDFCSPSCYHLFYKGKPLIGNALKRSKESIKKATYARKYNPEIRKKWLKKMKEVTLGPKNHKWIKDRSKLVNQDERNSFKYLRWRKSVIVRDGYKCKINNKDCDNCLEVHHIIAWRDNSKLHYKIINGITLCHTHHPRVRSEEKRLIQFFQGLIK
jgi:hypothetical protein